MKPCGVPVSTSFEDNGDYRKVSDVMESINENQLTSKRQPVGGGL